MNKNHCKVWTPNALAFKKTILTVKSVIIKSTAAPLQSVSKYTKIDKGSHNWTRHFCHMWWFFKVKHAGGWRRCWGTLKNHQILAKNEEKPCSTFFKGWFWVSENRIFGTCCSYINYYQTRRREFDTLAGFYPIFFCKFFHTIYVNLSQFCAR